jgi:hypothetical protein
MDQRARDVVKIGDRLFEAKANVDSLWQEIALNFYPERADFTTKRNDGEEFADHLFSSYPVLARRELGNVLSSYLYSRSQKRFSIHVADEEIDNGDAERQFLEHLSDIQWRAMYDSPAQWSRTTKESAHDFASFGNAVIKFGTNLAGDGLLFRSYHLRDNAWSENSEGKIDCNHRNWEPTARQLAHHFPKTASSKVKKAATKEPEKTFACRHVVLPSRMYDFKSPTGRRYPFVSLYVEKESETILEEVGLNYFCYVIPRWHTISGSQYGVSMATIFVLPDGRTHQVVIRTIREAGEKYADPPMLAVGDAIRGDIALYAGGVTNADIEYDERLGEVLRPISQQHAGFPIAIEVAAALKEDIRAGFFLDKIQLPETGKDMTAFEIRRRVEEHIRAQTPLFDPIEEQFAPLYEGVFNVMRDAGAFPMQDMPESIAGSDIRFSFFSPLSDLADQREAETYLDVRDRILVPAAQLDPAQLEHANWTEATRDAMRAAGWKAKWFNPKEAVAKKAEELAKAAAMQKGMEAVGAGGAVAEQAGKGMAAIDQAMNGEAAA